MRRGSFQIDAGDNVAVAVRALSRGEVVDGVMVRDDVPAGHKVALRDIAAGEPVCKYGFPIGAASMPIAAGSHVHGHNLASTLGDRFAGSSAGADPAGTARLGGRVAGAVGGRVTAPPLPGLVRTFDGYRRADGSVGIRNEIWIVNTVGCVNHASQRIAAAAERELAGAGSAIDGVHAFPHPFGCSQLGDDLAQTQKVLAGLVRHPNAAAVLVLGLGCENNQLQTFLESLGSIDRQRVRYFNAQDVTDEVEEGIAAIRELAEYAGQFRRATLPASELILGMKCGGSDGFSGITANPLVGRVADRLSAAGGTVLLSEVPEMFGAEAALLGRACDEHVSRRTIGLVNEFRRYFREHGQPIDENPSPGNKAGGITTLAEKSLGCIQKGGRAPIRDVLAYGQPAQARAGGVALVNAPGNDGVSGTAMTIAGAQMVLFTTGRGTPMGFPAPTIKISSNSDLARRKPQWIDFDAGRLIEEEAALDKLAAGLFDVVLDVASGRRSTLSEQNGYREIAIWKTGVTL